MDLLKHYLRIKSGFVSKIAPYTWIDDKLKIEYLFYKTFNYKLNLKNPKTFNEKLNWIKLYDRNPQYTKLSDKYGVRAYIKDKIGKNYLNPLLGVYENYEEIDWDSLPSQFVIKLTHGSHWNIFCFDKSKFNYSGAKRKIKQWINHNYYWGAREWQYKNIHPRIVIEKYITDGSGLVPMDYKVFCFKGKAKFIWVVIGRGTAQMTSFYFDLNWHLVKINRTSNFQSEVSPISKPKNLNEMLKISEKLADHYPFVRVDYFLIDGQILFGELTFTPFAGFCADYLSEADRMLGDLLHLQI